jgi:hypothetical protein
MPDRLTWPDDLDRRQFIAAAALPCLAPLSSAAAPADSSSQFTVEARFYEKLPYKKIKCKLCPRE